MANYHLLDLIVHTEMDSQPQKTILLVLATLCFNNETNHCLIKKTHLAEMCSSPWSSFKRNLKALEKLRIIETCHHTYELGFIFYINESVLSTEWPRVSHCSKKEWPRVSHAMAHSEPYNGSQRANTNIYTKAKEEENSHSVDKESTSNTEQKIKSKTIQQNTKRRETRSERLLRIQLERKQKEKS